LRKPVKTPGARTDENDETDKDVGGLFHGMKSNYF